MRKTVTAALATGAFLVVGGVSIAAAYADTAAPAPASPAATTAPPAPPVVSPAAPTETPTVEFGAW